MDHKNTKVIDTALSAALVLTAGAIASTAHAQTAGSIIQPQGALTSCIPLFDLFPVGNTIDQSGLSASYTSGTTDFDSFVPATSHNNSNADLLLCNSNGLNQPNGIVDLGETITFDLGSALSVDALAMWSTVFSTEAITAFDLHADTDDDFTNGTTALFGSYTPSATNVGQSFVFPPVTTRFVHIVVTGHGGGDFLRVGEFAFRYADPFLVTNTSDGPVAAAGDQPGSLRQAIFNANANPGADTISFDPALTGGTITLTEGEIAIDETVTINGLGADQLTISGGDVSRIFTLSGPGANTYTFNDLTIADGNSGADDGGAMLMFDGDDTININASILRNNRTAPALGAAIVLVNGTMNLSDCAVINNGDGQGTIYGQDGAMSFTNCTFSGNAGNFGVIWARGAFATRTTTISHCTFASNQTGTAAVFYSAETASAVTNIGYDHTIFADNAAPNFNVGGVSGAVTLTSNGYNLLDDATGDATPEATDLLNTDAMLGSLEAQAGTFVHPILPLSPAINGGDPLAIAGMGGVPKFDQRGVGFPRVADGGLDIGAVEFIAPPPCNVADFAVPFGALDFSDVLGFLTAFGSEEAAADLAPPTGAFDFSDVIAFLTAFGAGCP